VNAAPLHLSHPVGGVADVHGTGTPTGKAEPSPKPRFSKMRVYPLNGMISGFDGEKYHAYWIHTRVNK
jgi:hypothetical protein